MSRTQEKLAEDKAMAGWQGRALVATQGQKTQLGAILLAILKTEPSKGPKFGPNCYISTDGFMFANFVDRRGQFHVGAMVCSVRDYIANFHGLADALKLTDDERKDLFRRAREWVREDYRAIKAWGPIAGGKILLS